MPPNGMGQLTAARSARPGGHGWVGVAVSVWNRSPQPAGCEDNSAPHQKKHQPANGMRGRGQFVVKGITTAGQFGPSGKGMRYFPRPPEALSHSGAAMWWSDGAHN